MTILDHAFCVKRQCFGYALSEFKLKKLFTFFFLILLTHLSIAQNITTVAGGGVGDGGLATDANLNVPSAIALDGNGNFYIADTDNHLIRKINKDGLVSTVAGNGTLGFSGDGGAATNANLWSPTGVVVDANGDVYIVDTGNHRIRKVDTNGVITTIAGNGSASVYGGIEFSGDGGPAVDASLFKPAGIVIDSQKNLYIADAGNHRIRKVNTVGTITTIAGNGSASFNGDGGTATSAGLNTPSGVAIDGSGNLYIADYWNHRIRKVSTNGVITTIAGNGTLGYSGDGGNATSASLAFPASTLIDGSGNLLIADTYYSRIRKVNVNGKITTIAGDGSSYYSGDNTIATSASLNSPTGIAIDAVGNMYIADRYNHRIRKVDTNGIISTFAGTGSYTYGGDGGQAIQAKLHAPNDIAVDKNGTVYIADRNNNRIRKVDPNGIITTIAGNGTSGFSGDGGAATSAVLGLPSSIATDNSGNIFVVVSQRIRKINTNGIISTVAGNGANNFSGDGGTATSAGLRFPTGVAADLSGNIFIADTENHRVRKVNSEGIITTVAGNGSVGFSGDGGAATAASLNYPSGLAVDKNNNLYIVDTRNNRVRKVDSNGIITTVAGNGASGFSGDGGAATSASLRSPAGIAVDDNNNLYITDKINNRIRKVDSEGLITTVAGTGMTVYSGDGGLATNASIWGPSGIEIDNNGNIYFADTGNNRIRKVEAALSSNADLASLSLSTSYLPVFDPAVTLYKGNVINQITAVFVTPTVADANATVTVNGTATESGKWVEVLLIVGKNIIPVIVTAQDGTTKTYTVEVTRAYAPLALTTSQTNVVCYNGTTGSATVSVTGGATPYTYSWSPAGGTAATASNLKAGTYTVTVTDAQSQTATATVTITQPEALATIGSQTNVSCHGDSNGSATITVSGGIAPYTYAWLGSASTTATASNLTAGNYSVTVTDANGCTIVKSFTITQPGLLSATIAKTDVTTAGGSNGTATVSVSGGNAPYSYSWSPQGGTAATATGLVAGTYTVTVTDANSCTISKSVTIAAPAIVTTETVWLGTKSGDWHDAANWSNGVPTVALDVVIKAGGYMPDIPNNEPNPGYLAKNLTIEAGATFNLKTILDLHGNLINHGTFHTYHQEYDNRYHIVSRVHMHKPATIGGTKPVAFYQLWIEENAPVNLATDVSVLYNLSLKSDLNTNGKKLTLVSQKWYTINVQNEGGEVNGAVTVQRYIDPTFNSGAGYRHFSSPVTNTTVTDLTTAGFSPVVNAAYNTAEDPYAVKPFPTILGYDQSRLSNASEVKQKFDFGWYSPASVSSRLVPGVGYSLNIPATVKVDFVGTLNNGDITVTNLGRAATGAVGWHLLGNPYPSTLTWSSLNKPAGIDDAIYVYRSTGQYSGNYIAFVNGVGNEEANHVAAMQGFFVRVNNGPVDFTFTNDARSGLDAHVYKHKTDDRPQLQLQLTNKAGLTDDAFVYFQNGASAIVNGKYDAFKVLTYHEDRPTLFARVNADALSIKGLPAENGVQSLPLEIYVPQSGEYTFSAAKLVNFPAIAEVLLEDKETNQTYNLKQMAEVKLTLSPSTDPQRFVLRFSAVAGKPLSSGDLITTGVQVLVYPNPGKGNVNLIVNGLNANAGTVQVKLYNSIGQAVLQQNYTTLQVQDGVQLPTSDIATGVYYLQLNLDGKVITKKLVLQR